MRKLFTILGMMAFAITMSAQRTFNLNLYQGKPTERSSDKQDTAKVRVYLPADKDATGRAIVICPGGGYSHLAMDHEGYDWGEFFANQGIAAVVLKYRMPHGNPDVPITDAETAMRLVRRNAAQWHIKSNNIGIMGFSAGGHLASIVSVLSTGDAKPDFTILFYPVISMMDGYGHQGSHDNLIGSKASKRDEKKYSSDMHVSRVTPRAFIALSDDDRVVPPANGVNYYTELYRHDVPGCLHVYPSGGHGWGARMGFKHHLEMQLDLLAWLKSF